MRQVAVHIGELVLYDVPARDRFRIAAALERELTGLIAGQPSPLFVSGGDVERIDAGAVPAWPGADPASAGAALARAVHQGLLR